MNTIRPFLLLFSLLYLLTSCGVSSDDSAVDSALETTTFILVRHAEKAEGKDPVLSDIGMQRANRLATTLSNVKLDKIYCTSYQRTQLTAGPIADLQGLSISEYSGFDHEELIDEVFEELRGGKVLIVGHSNTTANFINSLLGTSDYENLSEDAYDDLFFLRARSMRDAELLHLKY